MHEDRFARFQLGIVKQHVLDGAEGHRRQSRADGIDAMRSRNELAGGNIDLFLREAVEVETVHALNMFTKIVTAFTARLADPAGARAVDRDELARQHIRNARANGLYHAGSLSTDGQRHLALGKRHAAPAPDVDVVQRHGLDAQRHLARTWCIRFGQVHFFELPVVHELKSAHVFSPSPGGVYLKSNSSKTL